MTDSQITVYGASDDLIEVEGAISEEFNAYSPDDDGDLLAFSDGTVLRIRYEDDGMWRIGPLAAGTAELDLQYGRNPDDDYSDRVTLIGDIQWVVFGKGFARARAGGGTDG